MDRVDERRGRRKRSVVAFPLQIGECGIGQFAAAGNESAEQDEVGEPAGPAQEGHGHGQRLNPLSNCSEICCAEYFNEVPRMTGEASHDIGWIGLGRMGEAMAARLVKAGHAISVWNRTASNADPPARLAPPVATDKPTPAHPPTV